MNDLLNNDKESTLQYGHWQSLSPIAIVYFAISTIKHSIGNFVYLAPALIAGYSTLKENPLLASVGLLVLISLPLGYGALSFLLYRFRLSDSSVEVRSGVFSKKHLNLPFERIQNVKFEQPIYYRLFGYSCIELDTAGSSGKEAKIVALPTSDAVLLKEQILSYAHHDSSEHNDKPVDADSSTDKKQDSDEEVLNTRSISDLVIHGLTSNRVWIILAALAPFYDNITTELASWMNTLGVDVETLFNPATRSMWQLIAFFIAVTLAIVVFMTLLSVLGAIFMFYGFTLSKSRERYIQRSGLITKREISMKVSRIQIAVRKQDWLDSILGRMNLVFEQKSITPQQGDAVMSMQQKLTIPSVKLDECHQLIDDAMPDNQMRELSYHPINKRFISRNILFRLFPPFIIFMGIIAFQQQYTALVVSGLALAICSALIALRWKRWGFQIDQQFLYIRKGLFGIDYYCVPIFKIQQTLYRQSVFMKRLKLANVEFVLASGLVSIPFVPQEMATKLVNNALYRVESDQRSWM